MRFLGEVKKWLGEITEIALLLIAVGIAVEILLAMRFLSSEDKLLPILPRCSALSEKMGLSA